MRAQRTCSCAAVRHVAPRAYATGLDASKHEVAG